MPTAPWREPRSRTASTIGAWRRSARTPCIAGTVRPRRRWIVLPACIWVAPSIRRSAPGRPAERVSRALEGNPAPEQPRRQEREGPELRPSGLERISRFDRELRQAIERAAAALRECVRELGHYVEYVGRWMRERELEAQRQREAEARRQREREWSRKLERDRDGPSFDRDR